MSTLDDLRHKIEDDMGPEEITGRLASQIALNIKYKDVIAQVLEGAHLVLEIAPETGLDELLRTAFLIGVEVERRRHQKPDETLEPFDDFIAGLPDKE